MLDEGPRQGMKHVPLRQIVDRRDLRTGYIDGSRARSDPLAHGDRRASRRNAGGERVISMRKLPTESRHTEEAHASTGTV